LSGHLHAPTYLPEGEEAIVPTEWEVE